MPHIQSVTLGISHSFANIIGPFCFFHMTYFLVSVRSCNLYFVVVVALMLCLFDYWLLFQSHRSFIHRYFIFCLFHELE